MILGSIALPQQQQQQQLESHSKGKTTKIKFIIYDYCSSCCLLLRAGEL